MWAKAESWTKWHYVTYERRYYHFDHCGRLLLKLDAQRYENPPDAERCKLCQRRAEKEKGQGWIYG